VSYDDGCFLDPGKRLLLRSAVSESHDVMKEGSLLFKESASRI